MYDLLNWLGIHLHDWKVTVERDTASEVAYVKRKCSRCGLQQEKAVCAYGQLWGWR